MACQLTTGHQFSMECCMLSPQTDKCASLPCLTLLPQQFLPQDKVSDFARLNAVELLVATEEAVGHGELAKMHDKLIALKAQHLEKEEVSTSLFAVA